VEEEEEEEGVLEFRGRLSVIKKEEELLIEEDGADRQA
jgi:hypothetical protein